MSTAEIVLGALWLIMAAATGLNWRAQLKWHRYYLDRLGPDGVTKSPVVKRDAPGHTP